ncbi:MAG: hypothetical protein OXH76_20780 [Boseongicola sp.]|nr:hypothetical protein [Boseongicola sp.]
MEWKELVAVLVALGILLLNINGRIDGVNGRIDGLSDRIDGLEASIARQDEKLENIGERLARVEGQLELVFRGLNISLSQAGSDDQ